MQDMPNKLQQNNSGKSSSSESISLIHEEKSLKTLYRFVILQAFEDYSCRANNRRVKGMKQRAYDWIMQDNQGFDLVCSLAELSPSCVRKKFIKHAEGKMSIAELAS